MKFNFLLVLLIMHCIPVSAKEVRLRIEQGLNKGTQYMSVDEDIAFLHFEKPSYLAKIEGLEQLQNLKAIVFNSTAFIEDFSFLSSCQRLETLAIVNVTLQSIAFIAQLPQLKYLVLESCRLESASFDLEANARLEYIDLSYNSLSRLPEFLGGASVLKFLNVSNNQIKEMDVPNPLRNVFVCAEGNGIPYSAGVSREVFFNMLPDEIKHIYQRF